MMSWQNNIGNDLPIAEQITSRGQINANMSGVTQMRTMTQALDGVTVAQGHVNANVVSRNDQERALRPADVSESNSQWTDSTIPRGPINAQDRVPWGWHFHPTPAELIDNLGKKLGRTRRIGTSVSEVLREIDLSKVEPWDIKHIHETCPIRQRHGDVNSQFFYTLKEQKYRHGKRNNRATKQGFWKATGRDKSIYGPVAARGHQRQVIGYRKALVFYKGRAPHGSKTDYILHEYRLKACSPNQEEQWVVCHMFIKDRNEGTKQPQEQSMGWADESDLSIKTENLYYSETLLQHGETSRQITTVGEHIAPSRSRYEGGLPGLVEEVHHSTTNPGESPTSQPALPLQELMALPSFRSFPSFRTLDDAEFMPNFDMPNNYQEPQPAFENQLWSIQ